MIRITTLFPEPSLVPDAERYTALTAAGLITTVLLCPAGQARAGVRCGRASPPGILTGSATSSSLDEYP